VSPPDRNGAAFHPDGDIPPAASPLDRNSVHDRGTNGDSVIPLALFGGFGVEIEFMIVDTDTLDVRPVADQLMQAVHGQVVAEFEAGPIAWSNELVLHVLELKTNGPAHGLAGLDGPFVNEVRRANAALAEMGCTLLPGGMHPWMDPARETRIWPHEYTEVYRTFDRIFSCQGHGWANLQSTHLNLPFSDDREFAALHAAIRAILPLIPALAASSPIVEGQVTDSLDHRLVEYARNARRIPLVTGAVIPEQADSEHAYRTNILEPIYRELAPLDPQGHLRHEWVNARGAIARFDRGAIEVRLVDPQECPAADIAVVAAVSEVVRGSCARILDGDDAVPDLSTSALAEILNGSVRTAEETRISDRRYLEALGIHAPGRSRRASEVWACLLEACGALDNGPMGIRDSEGHSPLETIVSRGTLARRIVRRTGRAPTRSRLQEVYRDLGHCLAGNRGFTEG